MKNKIKLAFIGCGNMARAVIERLAGRETSAALKGWGYTLAMTACDIDEAKLLSVQNLCATTTSAARAVSESDYIIVAVRPDDAEKALSELDLSGKVVVSVMAGVSLDRLHSLTACDRLVRCMPNINARAGESYTAFCTRGITDARTRREIEFILGAFGMFREIDEKLMPAATGLVGSAATFVDCVIDALYKKAVELGFTPDVAKEAVVQVVAGSVAAYDMFGGQGGSACTRGGTTAAGMAVLKEKGFESALCGAVEKSVERARELEI